VVRKSNRRSIVVSPRRLRRRDARRDGILRAAARMFRERGYAETGMRDIALAADLSPANLYHYFRGKDEILFYCQDRALDRMIDIVGAARRQERSAAAQLRRVLGAHLRVLLDEVEGATAHLQTEALPPDLRVRIVGKRDRYERALRQLVADGIGCGEFVACDPALVARAMLGALNWTVTWFDPAGPSSAARLAEDTAEYLVRGVTLRSPVAPRRLRLVAGADATARPRARTPRGHHG
jgi:AcrR family transcriptional regulator